MLTLDKIYHAAFVLKDVIRKTGVIHAPKLNPESNIYLKTENLQVTGSFKVRGAYYKISQLTAEKMFLTKKRQGVLLLVQQVTMHRVLLLVQLLMALSQ